jgi:hypothetical protein
MLNIVFSEGTEELLEYVKPLWEKTRDFHRDKSTFFKASMGKICFNNRKEELLGKAIDGGIRIHLAKDLDKGRYIGYCVSTVDHKKIGEIDSLFVELEYRNNGSISWFCVLALFIFRVPMLEFDKALPVGAERKNWV